MKKGTKIKIIRGKMAGRAGEVHEESRDHKGFFYVDLAETRKMAATRIMVSQGQLEAVKSLDTARL